ncbi:hypothetical protein ACVBGC_16065 [Burkholderia stagnalis]
MCGATGKPRRARRHGAEYKAMVERVDDHPAAIRMLDTLAHVDATQRNYEILGKTG